MKKDEQTVKKDGYTLTFYPGFLSRCGVRLKGRREKVLYEQEEVFNLAEGETEALARSRLVLRGGPNDRNFTLTVDDPQHEIARVIVELHPKGHVSGAGEEVQVAETVTFDEDPFKCPPSCEVVLPKGKPRKLRG